MMPQTAPTRPLPPPPLTPTSATTQQTISYRLQAGKTHQQDASTQNPALHQPARCSQKAVIKPPASTRSNYQSTLQLELTNDYY